MASPFITFDLALDRLHDAFVDSQWNTFPDMVKPCSSALSFRNDPHAKDLVYIIHVRLDVPNFQIVPAIRLG